MHDEKLRSEAHRANSRQPRAGTSSSVPEQSCIPPTHFLIANPELESHVSPIRISELKFPNRKYLAVLRVTFQTCATPLHASTASPSSIQRPAPSLQNPWSPWRLIETPRLEFLATPTKPRPMADSNRDKKRLSRSIFRRHSRTASTRNSLRDSVPLWPSQSATSRATLTLRAPQSNLAASCFVRAPLGEHS